MLVLISNNSGGRTNTATSIIMLRCHYQGGLTPVVISESNGAGTQFLPSQYISFGMDSDGYLTITFSRTVGTRIRIISNRE